MIAGLRPVGRLVGRLHALLSGLSFWHWMLIGLIAGPWAVMLYIKYWVLIVGLEMLFPQVHVP
jgi:hypothetical protein